MSASAQDIAEALYAAMTTPGSLNTNLGGRIHHQLAPQNQEQPYLVYDILADRVTRHFGGLITYECDAHFDIFIKRTVGTAAALGAGTLEENLFDALDGQELSVTGLDRGLVRFGNRGVRTIEEDVIRISNDATIAGTTGTAQLAYPLTYCNIASGTTRPNSLAGAACTIVNGVVTIGSGSWPTWAANGILFLNVVGVPTTAKSVATRDSDTQITLDDLTVNEGSEVRLMTDNTVYVLASHVIPGGLLQAGSLIVADLGLSCVTSATNPKLTLEYRFESGGGAGLVLGRIVMPISTLQMNLFLHHRLNVWVPGDDNTATHQSTTCWMYGKQTFGEDPHNVATVAVTNQAEFSGNTGTEQDVTLSLRGSVTFVPTGASPTFQLSHAHWQVFKPTGTLIIP